jgi:hypothetical protein
VRSPNTRGIGHDQRVIEVREVDDGDVIGPTREIPCGYPPVGLVRVECEVVRCSGGPEAVHRSEVVGVGDVEDSEATNVVRAEGWTGDAWVRVSISGEGQNPPVAELLDLDVVLGLVARDVRHELHGFWIGDVEDPRSS